MNTIKINITKDPKFGYSNLSFSEKPTEEMLQELKNNGWYYSKHFNRWYPATVEAKKNAECHSKENDSEAVQSPCRRKQLLWQMRFPEPLGQRRNHNDGNCGDRQCIGKECSRIGDHR